LPALQHTQANRSSAFAVGSGSHLREDPTGGLLWLSAATRKCPLAATSSCPLAATAVAIHLLRRWPEV
jgi:hypothetical protein